ncbi:MAG: type II toxin-antitoxin system VapC family toxin [Chloroflexota bacterium]|nr:type II toxin-antitoxin system VapC family toxin [Chloroflexota bacterium]
MTGVKVFVDTNILLRTILSQMKQHAEVDALVKRTLREGAELWINGQVIREFIVQATHPRTLTEPLTIEQVVQEIEVAKPLFRVADETEAVRDKLLELLRQYPTQGKQVHDANLVATMLAYEIDTLLTLNVDDLKRFEDKIKIISLEER